MKTLIDERNQMPSRLTEYLQSIESDLTQSSKLKDVDDTQWTEVKSIYEAYMRSYSESAGSSNSWNSVNFHIDLDWDVALSARDLDERGGSCARMNVSQSTMSISQQTTATMMPSSITSFATTSGPSSISETVSTSGGLACTAQ